MDSQDTSQLATKVESIGAEGQVDQRFQLTAGPYKVVLSSFGAAIVELWMPDHDGNVADCVLGFDKVEEYDRHRDLNPYFGCVVGRVANRVRDSKFTIDGQEVNIKPNCDAHILHGGDQDIHRKNWSSEMIENGVKFTIVSKDGDDGWPATMQMCATYTLVAKSASSADFKLFMTAKLVDESEGKSCPVCLTNHSYFNLDGHASPDGAIKNIIQVQADAYTEVDGDLVTSGNLTKMDDDPSMDFRKPRPLLQALEELKVARNFSQESFDKALKEKVTNTFGFDHNYCFGGSTQEPREIAKLWGSTGRTLTLQTTAAGVQCYTSNFIDKVIGKSGTQYNQWHAICLETQSYPNSISADGDKFPDFKKGETFMLRPNGPSYEHTALYLLGTQPTQKM